MYNQFKKQCKMKKIFYLMISALILCTSCKDDEKDYQTFVIKIQLAYPQGSPFKPGEGIEVTLTDSKGSSLKEKTDKTGCLLITSTHSSTAY